MKMLRGLLSATGSISKGRIQFDNGDACYKELAPSEKVTSGNSLPFGRDFNAPRFSHGVRTVPMLVSCHGLQFKDAIQGTGAAAKGSVGGPAQVNVNLGSAGSHEDNKRGRQFLQNGAPCKDRGRLEQLQQSTLVLAAAALR